MPDWQMKIITAEARRLLELAAEDAGLRAELRALAEEILAATEAPDPDAEPSPAATDTAKLPPHATPANAGDAVSHGPARPKAAPIDPMREQEPLRALTLGRRTPSSISPPHPAGLSVPTEADENDLDQIMSRCRWKAKAARRVAEQQRHTREGTAFQIEDASTDPEIAEWTGRLTDGFYWHDAPDSERPPDISLLDDAGGCFEAVAEGLSLVAACEDRRGAIERALPLLAEAQSMLRRALQRLQAPDDPDQLAVYEWVRDTAARHRLYLKRYMRAEDLAEPSGWPDLLARIRREQARQGMVGADSVPGALLDRLRTQLAAHPHGSGTARDWQAIIKTVDELITAGTPPSYRDIRDLLLPVLDELPDRDDLPSGFRLVLREIDRFLATSTPDPGAKIAHEPTAEVKEAARLLNGRSAVLIGGHRRRDAQEALKRLLGLKELVWIETKEHQAVASFEPDIARPDVVLVLLAIRWSSHAFGEVKHLCDRLGKLLVRLPGGYSPNQVAAQILSQVSGHLEG